MATTKGELLDSLPYIDLPVTDEQRKEAEKLIRRETANTSNDSIHPSMQSLSEPKFSSYMQQELARIAAGKPRKGGIDLSRYEEPDEPEANSDIETWRNALKHTYTLSAYLAGRRTNLTLLEELGKNAWLIGNFELEGILKDLEQQLAEVKAQTNEVNRARKSAQEGVKGELLGLEDTWQKGIARTIEVQIATEELRVEIQRRRRVATS